MLAATRGVRCVAVRLGITHGLGPVMKSDPRFMTVPNRFAQLAALGDPLTVHAGATKPAGFIELRDASLALQDALGLHLAEPYRAVNAVGECASVVEVARLVQQAARALGLTVSSSGPRKGETRAVRVETSLSTAVFRKPRRLADSIPEVLDFFLRSR